MSIQLNTLVNILVYLCMTVVIVYILINSIIGVLKVANFFYDTESC
jgi:hypothetical protein